MYDKIDASRIASATGIHENSYGFVGRLQYVLDAISDSLRDGQSCDVLDIGCGTGEYLTMPLGRLLSDRGVHILGIDTDLPSILHAVKANTDRNVTFMHSTVEALGDIKQYDRIICSEVLEHLDCPGSMMAQIYRLLRPDGICIVSVPNGYGPFEIQNQAYIRFKMTWPYRYLRPASGMNGTISDSLSQYSHVQFFTQRRIVEIFEKSGFRVVNKTNRVILCGPFTGTVIDRVGILKDINVRYAGQVPHWIASGWMFTLKKQDD